MANPYVAAIQINAVNGFSPMFALLASSLTGAHGQVNKLNDGFKRLNLGIASAATALAGIAGLKFEMKIAEYGNQLIDQQNQMIRLGRSQNDVLADTTNFYEKIAKLVPTADAAEYLQTVRELRAVTGDWQKADKWAVTALQEDALLKNIEGRSGITEHQGVTDFYKIMRSAEMKGISTNDEKLQEYVDTTYSMMQAFGAKLSPSDFQTLARRGSAAFINADIGKSLKTIGVMAADLGGSTAGTALQSLYAMQKGSMVYSKQQYQTLEAAGMIDPTKVIQQSYGKVQLEPEALIGSSQYRGDLPGWIQNVLRPHLMVLAKKEGKEYSEDYFESYMAKVLPNRKAAQAAYMFSDPGFVEQRMKDIGLSNEGFNLQKGYQTFTQDDSVGVQEAFWAQWRSMMEAIGKPTMLQAIPIMKDVTEWFEATGAWANAHPQLIGSLAKAFGELLAAMVVLGTAGVIVAFMPGGMVTVGILGLAAALKVLYDNWAAFKADVMTNSSIALQLQQMKDAWTYIVGFFGQVGTALSSLKDKLAALGDPSNWVHVGAPEPGNILNSPPPGEKSLGHLGLPTWMGGNGIWQARAGGGPVSAGGMYLIGENGPELFVPGSSGTIIPNSGSAGSGGYMEFVDDLSRKIGEVLKPMFEKLGSVSGGGWLGGGSYGAGRSVLHGRDALLHWGAHKAAISDIKLSGDDANALKQTAKALGTSAENLYSVIGYESAGTFSPSKWGGTGGNYMGLIQFGPSERAEFGASPDQTFKQQLVSVYKYLKTRGFQPGMGILDLYSTINAGSPGHYNASDGNNTVAGHVQQIMRDWLPRAREWLQEHSSDSAVPPPPSKKEERTSQLIMDGRVVGQLVERHIARSHRFIHGSGDHDGRMGLPVPDYASIG